MSKNYSTDNIYNILNTLKSLEQTQPLTESQVNEAPPNIPNPVEPQSSPNVWRSGRTGEKIPSPMSREAEWKRFVDRLGPATTPEPGAPMPQVRTEPFIPSDTKPRMRVPPGSNLAAELDNLKWSELNQRQAARQALNAPRVAPAVAAAGEEGWLQGAKNLLGRAATKVPGLATTGRIAGALTSAPVTAALAALTPSDTGPKVPSSGKFQGMEFNPITGAPWTDKQLKQYEKFPDFYHKELADRDQAGVGTAAGEKAKEFYKQQKKDNEPKADNKSVSQVSDKSPAEKSASVSNTSQVANKPPAADVPPPPPPAASRYKGTTGSRAIQAANPDIKDVNKIRPGQTLNIPGQDTPYVVQKGDTLDRIASRTAAAAKGPDTAIAAPTSVEPEPVLTVGNADTLKAAQDTAAGNNSLAAIKRNAGVKSSDNTGDVEIKNANPNNYVKPVDTTSGTAAWEKDKEAHLKVDESLYQILKLSGISEGSMSAAERKPTGPSHASGYWKGTDSASAAKDKYVGGAMEEGDDLEEQMRREWKHYVEEDDFTPTATPTSGTSINPIQQPNQQSDTAQQAAIRANYQELKKDATPPGGATFQPPGGDKNIIDAMTALNNDPNAKLTQPQIQGMASLGAATAVPNIAGKTGNPQSMVKVGKLPGTA